MSIEIEPSSIISIFEISRYGDRDILHIYRRLIDISRYIIESSCTREIIFYSISTSYKARGCDSFSTNFAPFYEASHIRISSIFDEFYIFSEEIRCDDLMA